MPHTRAKPSVAETFTVRVLSGAALSCACLDQLHPSPSSGYRQVCIKWSEHSACIPPNTQRVSCIKAYHAAVSSFGCREVLVYIVGRYIRTVVVAAQSLTGELVSDADLLTIRQNRVHLPEIVAVANVGVTTEHEVAVAFRIVDEMWVHACGGASEPS